MRKSLVFTVFTIIVFILPLTVQAADQGPREACKADAQSFCKDVQPGGGRILGCLKDHYKELSDGCYQALQNMAAHGQGGTSQQESNDHPQVWPPNKSHDGPPPPLDDGNGQPPPPPPNSN